MAISRIVPPPTPEVIVPPTPPFSFVIPNNTDRFVYNERITAGSYTLTCPSANIATVFFHSTLRAANQPEVTFSTNSGTVTFLLETDYDMMTARLNTGSNITCTLTRNSSYELFKTSVLDTITTTSTYEQTGRGMVLAIGAGEGGTFRTGMGPGGRGGHSGRATVQFANFPGSVPVVIGSGGTIGTSPAPTGNAGGDTQFGSIIAQGGSANVVGSSGGAGGVPNFFNNHGGGGGGGATNGGNGAATGSGFSINQYSIISAGTGGTGGTGGQTFPFGGSTGGSAGGAGGIYAGGGGGGSSTPPAIPGFTGHPGGGGGGGVAGSGSTGGAGAVYVLRFLT